MLTVDDYAIRTAHRDGMTIRQIARTFHVSRHTVREMSRPEPKPYTRTKPPPPPSSGPSPDHRPDPPRRPGRPAQAAAHRRPALPPAPGRARLPRLYPTVRRYVAAHRPHHRETFIPLAHPPGHRLRPTSDTSTSTSPTAAASSPSWSPSGPTPTAPSSSPCPPNAPRPSSTAWSRALEFFGCVPREVWWDNPKTVATLILRGRQRQLHPRYAALASHYTFEAKFCLPAQATRSPTSRAACGPCSAVRHARAARRRPHTS